MEQVRYKFNKEKTLNVILYLAQKIQRRDFHKIFKLLYFIDREFLKEYGMPITGDTYIAMDAGPVPSKTYDMFKMVRGDSYAPDTEGLGSYLQVVKWMYIVPLREPNMKALSQAEKTVIDNVIVQYGSLSYDEIKEKSHDMAWRSTAKDYPIAVENIAFETGMSEEDMPYIVETAEYQNRF